MKVRLSLYDAIGAHRSALTAVYTAPAGRPLQRAMQASDDALDVLLGTPAGDIQGAKDLLAYLRWWLKESGDDIGHYGEAHYVAQARVADLAMLLFAPATDGATP